LQAIVGLGNPGPAYAKSRHNIGFWVVDAIAAEAGLTFRRRGLSFRAHGSVAGHDLILAKPQTFMNCSGPAVAELLADVGLVPSDLRDMIVVHDDLDLDPGRIRLKARGGHGGHNGVLSLIDALENDRFPRLKVGVGHPPEGIDAADYVLASVSGPDRAVLAEAVDRAVEVLHWWMIEGLASAMNRFNRIPND
jgi:PTH1 family peptidyl-tRNA hydrolase